MRHSICISLCLLLIAGCRKNLTDNRVELDQTSISCPYEGGVFEIGVSGRPDWTTDNTAEWIDISREQGKARICISGNKGKQRKVTLGFRINGTTVSELEIIQEHSDVFEISDRMFSISHKGGRVSSEITVYSTWSASTDSEWITLDRTGSDGPAVIELNISANPSATDRTGLVNIASGDKNLTIYVTQKALPLINIETDIVEFDGDGGQAQVLYMSNTEVSISCNEDWIRIISTESSIKKVSFEANRNLGSSREGVIRLTSADDEEIHETITVRQGPKIDHPKISIAEGNHLDISSRDILTLHPVFEDMTDHSVTWKSDNPDIASVDAKGVVTIHTGGTCTITASNSFHDVTASISLQIRLLAQDMKVMFGVQEMNESPVAVRFAGEKISIKVIMDPVDAYSDDITYYSTDDSVASIFGNTIHCLKPGKSDIFIESLYQSIRQKYTVIVTE